MINVVNLWASLPSKTSYEHFLKEVFKEASKLELDGETPKYDEDGMFDLSTKMWGDWIDANTNQIQVIPPTSAPAPISGTTPGPTGFAPDFKKKITALDIATELGNQFEAYILATAWLPPTPAPPFSAITTVSPNAASVSAAKASLISGLASEFLTPCVQGSESTKYMALSMLFFTAFSSIMLDFIGLSLSSPPTPLTIPSPIM